MMRLSSSSTARLSTCSSELHPLFAGFAWCYEMGRTLELPSPFVGPRRAKNGQPGGAARLRESCGWDHSGVRRRLRDALHAAS